MTVGVSSRDCNVHLVYDRYIGEDSTLVVLQDALRELAPAWSSGLIVFVGREPQPVEVERPGALRDRVVDAATYRGRLYEHLVKEHGGGSERRFGKAEIRGGSRPRIVVVSIDEDPQARIGGRLLMNNSITFQVKKGRFERRPTAAWCRQMLEHMASQSQPAWGALYAWELSSAPVDDVQDLGEGMVLALRDDPGSWADEGEAGREEAVLTHLGHQHFFRRTSSAGL